MRTFKVVVAGALSNDDDLDILMEHASYGFRGTNLVQAIKDNIAAIPPIAGEVVSRYRLEDVHLMYGRKYAVLTVRWHSIENNVIDPDIREAVLFIEASPEDVPEPVVEIYQFVRDIPE